MCNTGPVPCAEPIPAVWLLIHPCKEVFLLTAIVSLIVVSSFGVSRDKARNLESFIVVHWTDFCYLHDCHQHTVVCNDNDDDGKCHKYVHLILET